MCIERECRFTPLNTMNADLPRGNALAFCDKWECRPHPVVIPTCRCATIFFNYAQVNSLAPFTVIPFPFFVRFARVF